MHKLAGPLWGFFQNLRHKTPIPLAIDQYHYFLSSFLQVNVHTLSTEEDLLAFTKIFWLHDPGFEPQYDYYFKTFLDWDKLIPKPLPEIKPDDPSTNSGDPEKKVDPGKTDPRVTPPKPVEPAPVSKTENEEALVEFKLVIKETEQEEVEEKYDYTSKPHDFILTDMAIMPFDNRNFIQRLRRKVETAELVPTDILDIPSMINDYIQKGFIGDIQYELNDASHSNVVFLADRDESMLAFDYLENYFVRGLKQLPHCKFEYFTFKQIPGLTADGEHYKLTAGLPNHRDVETDRHHWNQDTWFLIFSDAGALTGMVERDRIISTMRWWTYFRNISRHTYWINPVPFEQMNDCTAKRLQMTIPMADPTDKALYQMIHSKKSASR